MQPMTSMYKIKDDVDLRELEKYEFIPKANHNNFLRMIEKDGEATPCFVYISTNIDPIVPTIPRCIYVGTPLSFSQMTESTAWAIEDLLEAGLVERVAV